MSLLFPVSHWGGGDVTRFDGGVFLDRGADLTGAADGPRGMFFAVVKIEDGAAQNTVMRSDDNRLQFVWNTSGRFAIFIQKSTSNANNLELGSNQFPAGSGFHRVLASWDAAIDRAQLYVDDVVNNAFGNNRITTSDLDYTRPDWAIGDSLSSPGTARLKGCLHTLWLHISASLDIAAAANRRLFHDTVANGLKVADLGAKGQTPIGTIPIGYWRGLPVDFPTNLGTGGGMTLKPDTPPLGVLRLCSTSP